MTNLSRFSIDALTDIITGGTDTYPVPHAPYRTCRELQKFFLALGLRPDINLRVPDTRDVLLQVNNQSDGIEKLTAIVEAAVDQSHFHLPLHSVAKAVEQLNLQFEQDGLQVRMVEGRYQVIELAAVQGAGRVKGAPKNLIFASTGPKPDVVLVDAINNDIKIVKNAEFCLVYERPISKSGLKWGDLVDWWANKQRKDPEDPEVQRDLYKRLLEATRTSPPEKLLFEAYYQTFREVGAGLPALVPQVYLHYDQRTVNELYGAKRLPRQRMDFLMLLSDAVRVVIEVDGQQHYSESGSPSPVKYAGMVAADRQLRLAGYEVFRFGGAELQREEHKEDVARFFLDLFAQHGLKVLGG
jgi:hypothetical protein